jgi:hypothetical protein
MALTHVIEDGRWVIRWVPDTVANLSTAADLPFNPDGSIDATNVQAAIQEVRDEASRVGHVFDWEQDTDPALDPENNVQPDDWWADTSSTTLNRRNGTNDGWIAFTGPGGSTGDLPDGAVIDSLGNAVIDSLGNIVITP